MHKEDTKTPSSFLTLTVGIFIGAMFVLPMFAYMCRVNGQLRQENLRLRVQVARHDYFVQQYDALQKDVRNLQMSSMHFGPMDTWEYRNRPHEPATADR